MTTIREKQGLRVTPTLWNRYADVVGNAGRSGDLRRYMEWRIDNPAHILGRDPGAYHGPVCKLRVSEALWRPYARVVARGDCSADLRTYMQWRVEHPDDPLPGQVRVPPARFRRRAA